MYSYKDAQSFRKLDNEKLNVIPIDAHIYQVPSKPTVIYARVNSVFVANLFKYLINGNTYTKSFGKELFVTNKKNKLALLKG